MGHAGGPPLGLASGSGERCVTYRLFFAFFAWRFSLRFCWAFFFVLEPALSFDPMWPSWSARSGGSSETRNAPKTEADTEERSRCYSPAMLDLAKAYEETQQSVAGFIRGLSPDQLKHKVPASPAWSVQDVVAHVAGLAGDVAYDRAPTELDVVRALTDSAQAELRDQMTDKQVSSRRGRSVDELLGEWTTALQDLIPMIGGKRPFPRAVPFVDAALVTDLATHNQDVRNALGIPGDRDSQGVSVAFVGYAGALGLRIAMNRLPALRLQYDGKERVVGEGEPAATATADRYELYRALAGRRSRDQILNLNWEGDPEPYVDLIPAYGPRSDPLEE